MRRVVLGFAALAVALAAFIATGSETALAYRAPGSPITLTSNRAAVKALLGDPALGTGSDAITETGLARMQMAAGRLAPLRFAGEIGLIATGSIIVWKIADAAGLGGFIYKKITGESYATGPYTGAIRWSSVCPSGCTYSAAGGFTSGQTGWFLNSSHQGVYTNPLTNMWSAWRAEGAYLLAGPGTPFSTTDTSCLQSAGTCLVNHRTEAAMNQAVTMQPSSAAEFASPPSGATTVTAGTDSTAAISDANLDAALAAVGANDTTNRTSTDLAAEKATDYINHQLDPTYSADNFVMPNCVGLSVTACGGLLDSAGQTGTRTYTALDLAGAVVTLPAGAIVTQTSAAGVSAPSTSPVTFTRNPDVMPILLPQPALNETYDQYKARLVALGYLGSVSFTLLTDATAQPALGPDAPVRIRVGTTTTVLDPLAWPSPAPRIAPTTDISIDRNPATMAPATEPPPAPGTTAGGGCDCPPLDFGPLTSLSLGSKFPFGIFGYLTHTLDLFDVSPQSPRFDILVHAFEIVGGTPKHYTGNLDAFSPYMAIVRGLLTFCLWVGALWFVGTKMLGFGSAGDLSETVDDGSVF